MYQEIEIAETALRPVPYIMGIDYETSAYPEDGGLPIEVAAEMLDASLNTIGTFCTRISLPEGAAWSEEAYKVHKIAREDLDLMPNLQQASSMLAQWIASFTVNVHKVIPLAHNYAFDQKFLDMMLIPKFKKIHLDYRHFDTLTLAGIINSVAYSRGVGHLFMAPNRVGDIVPSVSLESMRNYFGISHVGAHGAAKDIADTCEVFRRCTGMMTLNINGAQI